jgi:hypothetical protein
VKRCASRAPRALQQLVTLKRQQRLQKQNERTRSPIRKSKSPSN